MVRPLRRKAGAREAERPPVPLADPLPLYQVLFPELGVSEDTPTVRLHTARCGLVVDFVAVAPPDPDAECTCVTPFPRTVATVADGWDPVDEVHAYWQASTERQGII